MYIQDEVPVAKPAKPATAVKEANMPAAQPTPQQACGSGTLQQKQRTLSEKAGGAMLPPLGPCILALEGVQVNGRHKGLLLCNVATAPLCLQLPLQAGSILQHSASWQR